MPSSNKGSKRSILMITPAPSKAYAVAICGWAPPLGLSHALSALFAEQQHAACPCITSESLRQSWIGPESVCQDDLNCVTIVICSVPNRRQAWISPCACLTGLRAARWCWRRVPGQGSCSMV